MPKGARGRGGKKGKVVRMTGHPMGDIMPHADSPISMSKVAEIEKRAQPMRSGPLGYTPNFLRGLFHGPKTERKDKP